MVLLKSKIIYSPSHPHGANTTFSELGTAQVKDNPWSYTTLSNGPVTFKTYLSALCYQHIEAQQQFFQAL